MWERTLTVQSAGSTFVAKHVIYCCLCSHPEAFAATGWRVGWLIGPPSLIKYVCAATTRIVFTTNTPLQEAAAAGLEQATERKFFQTQTKEYEERKDVLIEAFERLGLPYTVPEGSYFALLVRCRDMVALPLTYIYTSGHLEGEDSGQLQVPCVL
jgi:kynurenine aminotransferase